MKAPKTVAILAMPGVQLLDVSGPLDVFAEANLQARAQAYRLQVIATRRGPVRSSSGVLLMPDTVIGDAMDEPIHTLLVAGSPHAADAVSDANVTTWLRKLTPKMRRFGSVCSGAFVLAQAGLLNGRRVTTHWAVADQLAQEFPSVTVDADAIHVRDGRLRTAAGVTAGLDLSLALVEEDLGRDIAMKVAAQLVMFFKRPGGQMQFSRKGEAMPAGRSALQELQRWIAANPRTITALQASPAGWISARAISPGSSAARSASRRQPGSRRRGSTLPAAFSSRDTKPPSRSRLNAAFPMPIRCAVPSCAMSA